MPFVKGVDRNQITLFPENVEDYITSDNQVRVIDAYVEQLDMDELRYCQWQTIVDSKHKLICDFEVTTEPNDLGQLSSMVLRAKEILEAEELAVLADKGYYETKCLKSFNKVYFLFFWYFILRISGISF
jgi:hypothetical protein